MNKSRTKLLNVGYFLLKMIATVSFGATIGGTIAAVVTQSNSYATGITGGVLGLVGFLVYQAYNTSKK